VHKIDSLSVGVKQSVSRPTGIIVMGYDAGQAFVARKIAKNTIPSAKAIARIDCTNIFVAAPGLRPTASDA
jgi:hypothetical protein